MRLCLASTRQQLTGKCENVCARIFAQTHMRRECAVAYMKQRSIIAACSPLFAVYLTVNSRVWHTCTPSKCVLVRLWRSFLWERRCARTHIHSCKVCLLCMASSSRVRCVFICLMDTRYIALYYMGIIILIVCRFVTVFQAAQSCRPLGTSG